MPLAQIEALEVGWLKSRASHWLKTEAIQLDTIPPLLQDSLHSLCNSVNCDCNCFQEVDPGQWQRAEDVDLAMPHPGTPMSWECYSMMTLFEGKTEL